MNSGSEFIDKSFMKYNLNLIIFFILFLLQNIWWGHNHKE